MADEAADSEQFGICWPLTQLAQVREDALSKRI